MTTAPFGIQIRPRPGAQPQPSPYGIVMVVPRTANVIPAVSELFEITSGNVDAQLGTAPATDPARRWYNHIESKANVHIAVAPFDPSDPDVNAPLAIAALESSSERAKLSFSPDIILVPDYTGRAQTASAIVTRLETACANPSVLARGIVDAYNPGGIGGATATQAEVLAWAGANTGPHILAMSNNAPVGGVEEWGSVIVAAHLCQDAALHGVGTHPFSLSHPVSGVGTPVPVRVFDITDGSAEAEALADADVSSLILYDGNEFIWNGKTDQASAGDPREYFGNAVISDRMVKLARQTLAPYYGQRASTGVLASMADHVQLALEPVFITPGLVSSITIIDPYLSGTTAIVEFEVGFHGFIESIRLVADIFVAPA